MLSAYKNIVSNTSSLLVHTSRNKLASQCVVTASRHQFTHTTKRLSSEQSDRDEELVYKGLMNDQIKRVKLLSLSTATCSLLLGPYIALYGKATLSLATKMVIGSCVGTVGVSTTLLLHSIARRYVTKMYFDKYSHTFKVETYSLLGRTLTSTFSVGDITVPDT